MDEQKLQFRVGLLVLFSVAIAGVLVVRFGGLKQYWEKTWAVAIHFDEAPGVQPGTPVKMNGILIGRARQVAFDETDPGVLVVVDIQAERKLRTDSKPTIARSLFGDATIEFTPGQSREFLPPNMKLQGESPVDPLAAVQEMQVQVSDTLASFKSTSAEWEQVGKNFNELMLTERGSLDDVIERTALVLDDFAKTMKAAHETLASTNQVIADPEVQRNLRETIAALPQLVAETRDTIAATKRSIEKVNDNLAQVQAATAPLAEHSRNMVSKLDGGLIQLESLLTELNSFATMLNDEDGTLQQLISDPALYNNLNRSAGALAVILDNLEPTLRDVRIFADKVARHPEVLGVRGAISGSSGLKEASEIEQTGGIR
jgi:phospholipid/cholesterol/gamma-HCH transport system substrate-binding protein